MRKITAILCALILVCATFFVACDNKNEPITTKNLEPSSFSSTETVLIENSKSDYKIVIPEVSTQMEKYAATELQKYLYEATGCTLQIITDEGLQHDNSQKLLSIGQTSLLKAQTDIVIDINVMGETAPSIDTIENTVYMVGADSYGTINAVYKFLQYQIGFKVFAYDCEVYNYSDKLMLLDFDYHYIPNVEWVVASDHEMVGTDAEKLQATTKLNLLGTYQMGYKMFSGPLYNGYYCHSMQEIMPESSYPWAWRNSQLCMSDPQVISTFSKILCDVLTTAEGPAIMLGNNDNTGVCNCERCEKVIAKYGTGKLMLDFINQIAEIIENDFAEKNIDRKLIIAGLFYMGYTTVPVVKNADGSYSPIDDTVKFDKEGNVTTTACYCPIEACYIHSFGDDCCEFNKTTNENLRKWATLTDELFVYTYGSNWSGGIAHSIWYNNWSSYAGNFKFYDDIGVKYYFDESNSGGISPFSSMRVYVRSRLAWNANLNFYDLVDEFTNAYYGIVAEDIREYFNAVMEHYEMIYKMSKETCQSCYFSISLRNYWPQMVFEDFATVLENAMYKIETSNLSEKEKDILLERVKREWYILKLDEYYLHKDYVDKDTLKELELAVQEGKEKYVIVGQD